LSVLLAVTEWDPAPWLARFAALAPDRTVVTPETSADPASIHYAVSWRHRPGALAGLPNLKAIFSLGAVVDPELTARMSEWVVMQVLLHHRQFRRYDRQQAQKIWAEDEAQPVAAEVRVGILGLGELGLDAARKLRILGFDVAGWTRSRKFLPDLASFHGPAGLDALLARTDILVCLLPLTPDTRGLLNGSLFARLAHDGRLGGPFLINAGRGGSQVEADILAALDAGVLKGASLDVFETEPLPASSPLWTHPNVYLSPHNSAISSPEAIARYIVEQIVAFERGEPLRNVVDRARGY
jgi:glyoxylate/hydroxypyruvate reductase A